MIGINRVTLLGRAAADPELRQTQSGQSMVTLVIAVPGLRDGEATVDYFEVVAWNATAEACAKFVKKGMPLYAEGRLIKRVWDGEDGKKRSRFNVSAQRVVFLGSKPSSAGEAEPAAAADPATQEVEQAEADPS